MWGEVKLNWTGLQRHQGPDYLQWLQNRKALRTGLCALAEALRVLLDDRVRTRRDARDLWTAVPSVLSQCNKPETYRTPAAPLAYAWLHLLDRYVRTWLALQLLVKKCLLPMGIDGVRTLDVGTGPGPSAFAIYDFYTAMTKFAEVSRNERWRQPVSLTCVESSAAMNHFRHHLAETLFARGSSKGVLDMCRNLPEFKSVQPSRERKELDNTLRNMCDDYYDGCLDRWESEPRFTARGANYVANNHHRYRLFTFSNFFTMPSTVDCCRPNLIDILKDAHPGSVLLVIGGSGVEYPCIYSDLAKLAKDAGFSRKAERLHVSSSDVEVKEIVSTELAHLFSHLKNVAKGLAVCPTTKKLMAYLEGKKPFKPPTSAIHAYRK